MKESILPLLLKMVADRSASTRKELGSIISSFQSSRLLSSEFTSRELLEQDIECISILLLLRGDDTEDVVNVSREVLIYLFTYFIYLFIYTSIYLFHYIIFYYK
jgi:hypothetical protein